jgi:hypothetical protein
MEKIFFALCFQMFILWKAAAEEDSPRFETSLGLLKIAPKPFLAHKCLTLKAKVET